MFILVIVVIVVVIVIVVVVIVIIIMCLFSLTIVYPTGSSKTASHMTSHMSMSATLMLVLDNNLCQLQHHMMIAGTLMRCKKNVCSVS